MFRDRLEHLINTTSTWLCVRFTLCASDNRHLRVIINHHNADMFNSLTRKIKNLTVCENRDMVDFNVGNNFITPYMHRKIYTRRR